MSVIPTVYNQGTGLIGSTTSGAAIPSNVDDLIINDTLLVGGEATFNGAVTVNNSLSVTGSINFQDVTVQGTFILEGKTPTQLAFYTTGGELTGTADMTYSGGVTTMTNVTVTTALSFGALTKTDSNNYAVAFHDNNRICVAGSPNVLTYNPFDGLLAVPNVTVGDELTVTNNLQITNVPTTGGPDKFTRLNILYKDSNGSIHQDANLTFRPNDGRITALMFDGDLEGYVKLFTSADTTSNDNRIPFIVGGTNIGNLSQNSTFTYNPNSNTLAAQNINVGQDITMTSGTLTANAVSADFIRIQPLPSGNPDAQVPLVFCDTTDNNTLKQDTEPTRLSYRPNLNKFFTGNAEINNQLDVLGIGEFRDDIVVKYNSGSGDVSYTLYDKSTGYLRAPTKLFTTGELEVLGPAYLNPTIYSDNAEYGVLLFDTSTNEVGQESIPAQLSYNPNGNRLTVRNLTAAVSVTSALPTTNFPSEHICFFQNPGGTNQNRFEKDGDGSHYTYNPGEGRLTVYKLRVTDSANITGLTITPSTRGTTSADHQVVFYDSTTSQFCIDDNSTQFTYDPNLNKLKVENIDASVSITSLAPTLSDDINCRVTFLDSNSNTGKISSNNQLFFNPDNETLRTSNMNVNGQLNVTASGLNSGQMNVDSTLYFVYNHATGHTFRIAGNWKLRLFNTSTVIYTPLFLQDVTVPAASASLPILCHNNSNEVKKTNVSGTNQITVDPFQGRLTTKDIYVTGAIYNNSFGPVLNYVVTFSTRINGTGDAYTTNGTSGTWGNDALIQWPTQASAGGEPRVSQYGSNISDGTGTKYGAVVFTESTTDTEFMLLSDNYSGWWFVDISLLWQNTSSTRQMPRIDLGKRLTAGGAITEQPQVNQAAGYSRNDSGELLNLHICGPVYMASAANKFVILTKLEDAASNTGGIAVPPNWSDSTTAYKALGLNISCKYLGNAEDAGETVNTL